jgi:hypothetical protein
MTAQENSSQPQFKERANANNVPVARLIGFEAKDIGDGRATVTLSAGPQHANPHLTAIHDAMLPVLGIGQRLYPEFDVAFISNPDKTHAGIPSVELIRKAWKEVNGRLFEGFASLSAADWLKRHGAVSEEDFVKEPLRNRLAILLSRTNHLAYHLGQTALRPE